MTFFNDYLINQVLLKKAIESKNNNKQTHSKLMKNSLKKSWKYSKNKVWVICWIPWTASKMTKIMERMISVKFIYSEKATKFRKIFTLLLSCVMPVKSKVKISQNFVAFSEYMNFNKGSKFFKSLIPKIHSWRLD